MMLATVYFGSICVVVWWRGWAWPLRRNDFEVLGERWPTVHAGPVKLITGPNHDHRGSFFKFVRHARDES